MAFNVPGLEHVQCLVTDGDIDKLVSDMMDTLRAMSDAAYEKIKDSCEDVLEQPAEIQTDWDEREHAARSHEEDGDDAARSPEDGDDAARSPEEDGDNAVLSPEEDGDDAARSPEEDGDDAARSPEDGDDVNDKESRPPTNPYKKLM